MRTGERQRGVAVGTVKKGRIANKHIGMNTLAVFIFLNNGARFVGSVL